MLAHFLHRRIFLSGMIFTCSHDEVPFSGEMLDEWEHVDYLIDRFAAEGNVNSQ